MSRKFFPPPMARRLFAYPDAVHYWRLDDAAAPYVNYGSSTLTLKNTGTSGTVTPRRRSVLTVGIETALSSGTTRNTIYTDNPASNADIITGQALTVSAWCTPNDLTSSQGVVVKHYDSNIANWAEPFGAWSLSAVGGTPVPSFQLATGTAGSGTRKAAIASIQVRPREPSYLVGVYDGTTAILYVNGCVAASVACTGNIDNGSSNSGRGGPISVGGTSSTNAAANGASFGGTIEEVTVENVALGREAILRRYLRGLGLFSNGGLTIV